MQSKPTTRKKATLLSACALLVVLLAAWKGHCARCWSTEGASPLHGAFASPLFSFGCSFCLFAVAVYLAVYAIVKRRGTFVRCWSILAVFLVVMLDVPPPDDFTRFYRHVAQYGHLQEVIAWARRTLAEMHDIQEKTDVPASRIPSELRGLYTQEVPSVVFFRNPPGGHAALAINYREVCPFSCGLCIGPVGMIFPTNVVSGMRVISPGVVVYWEREYR